MGLVDEANSAIGLAICALPDADQRALVTRVQNDLFDLGADLATPAENNDFSPSDMVLRIVASQPEWIEAQIDALNERLEPLTSFVLPGGSEAAARVHVARATTRAAERAMVQLADEVPVNPAALAYINRLSDLLFVLARVTNDDGQADVKWVPGKNR
jgi:cob(I)alamin adenosyltransferase